jgi:hypothetical protein
MSSSMKLLVCTIMFIARFFYISFYIIILLMIYSHTDAHSQVAQTKSWLLGARAKIMQCRKRKMHSIIF